MIAIGCERDPIVNLLEKMFQRVEPVINRGDAVGDLAFIAIIVIGSQLVSNVPLVLVAVAWVPHMPEPTWGYIILAVASTRAGNLTLFGSVANVAQLRTSRSCDRRAVAIVAAATPAALQSTSRMRSVHSVDDGLSASDLHDRFFSGAGPTDVMQLIGAVDDRIAEINSAGPSPCFDAVPIDVTIRCTRVRCEHVSGEPEHHPRWHRQR
ncbi:MAG: hypothetical protein ABI591_05735 [Kofleriaceae bacterium]